MIEQLDHLVILVERLDRAVQDYTTLGFNVSPGGEHSDGATHNALIAFADGTYLELIAFRRSADHHRWWQDTARGEGLIDFALLPDDTATVIAEARARGLTLDGPTDGGRIRPDGVELRWQTGLAPTPDLPFLCGDVTPRDLRVPSGAAHVHPNGAQGIATLTVAVADLAQSTARYAALLGRRADATTVVDDAEAHSWRFGTSDIILVAPAADGVVARWFVDRGEGPLAFTLRTTNAERQELDPSLTHGVPISFA